MHNQQTSKNEMHQNPINQPSHSVVSPNNKSKLIREGSEILFVMGLLLKPNIQEEEWSRLWVDQYTRDASGCVFDVATHLEKHN